MQDLVEVDISRDQEALDQVASWLRAGRVVVLRQVPAIRHLREALLAYAEGVSNEAAGALDRFLDKRGNATHRGRLGACGGD